MILGRRFFGFSSHLTHMQIFQLFFIIHFFESLCTHILKHFSAFPIVTHRSYVHAHLFVVTRSSKRLAIGRFVFGLVGTIRFKTLLFWRLLIFKYGSVNRTIQLLLDIILKYLALFRLLFVLFRFYLRWEFLYYLRLEFAVALVIRRRIIA